MDAKNHVPKWRHEIKLTLILGYFLTLSEPSTNSGKNVFFFGKMMIFLIFDEF